MIINFGIIKNLTDIGGIERLKKIYTGFSFVLGNNFYVFSKHYNFDNPTSPKYHICKNRELILSGNYDIINYFASVV